MRASDYRRIARENLSNNWGTSILVALAAAWLGGLVAGLNFSLYIDLKILTPYLTEQGIAVIVPIVYQINSIGSTVSFAQLVLGGVVSMGLCTYLLAQHDRNAPLEFKTLFSRFDLFSKGLYLRVLQFLYSILWFILLVVPGVIKCYSYSMACFIMEENPHLSPSAAITASRKLMKGHKWKLFCLDLSFFLWFLLSLATLGLGFMILNPYINAAHAAFYRQLCPKNNPNDISFSV